MSNTTTNKILEHARSIADPLSRSLAELEAPSTVVSLDGTRQTIHATWLSVIEDLQHKRADLSSAYLANLHQKLNDSAEIANPSGFTEQGFPPLTDGTPVTWTRFMQECGYEDEIEAPEEYALAQLRWGGHVSTFALSLGWFAMNIIRIRRGDCAVYPPPVDHARLLKFLADAGPDDYDAETGFRGLASEYAKANAKEALKRGKSNSP